MAIRPKLQLLWDSLRTSFWFVPSLMVAAVCLLDRVIPLLERAPLPGLAAWLDHLGPGTPENARALLSTVAGSMITVSGVTFSVVMVALSIASSQFGPRLLVNFMRDRGNQLVLGSFVATFVFSLLALRRIGGEGSRVPHLTVAAVVLLTFASLGVLIYFFHHVATSIQAGNVVAQAGDQLTRALHGHHGDPPRRPADGRRRHRDDLPGSFDEDAAAVASESTGYLAEIDAETLLAIAVEHDLRLRVETGEGDFVVVEGTLCLAAPAERLVAEVAGDLRDAFLVTRQRGTGRGVELAIDRLVEIAIRALSPGINDPFTALACVDRLAAGLASLAEEGMPPRTLRDDAGEARVVLRLPTVPELVERAFQQIRVYGAGDPTVVRRLLEAIALVAARGDDPAFRRALRRQAESVVEAARRELGDERDVAAAERRLEALAPLLGEGG